MVSAAQAAERLGLSLRTVRRRIADGTLPSVKIGGAVRIPASALEAYGVPADVPRGHAARESPAPYETAPARDRESIRRWNQEHWPDSWERMLERRREGFAELAEIRKRTKPPSGPHDTVDAMLDEVREAFGQRLLQYLPPAKDES